MRGHKPQKTTQDIGKVRKGRIYLCKQNIYLLIPTGIKKRYKRLPAEMEIE